MNLWKLTFMTYCFVISRYQSQNGQHIYKYIKPNVSLPKDDDEFDIREKNLETARKNYQLEQKTHMFLDVEQRSMDDVILNLPPMVSCYENINQKNYL